MQQTKEARPGGTPEKIYVSLKFECISNHCDRVWPAVRHAAACSSGSATRVEVARAFSLDQRHWLRFQCDRYSWEQRLVRWGRAVSFERPPALSMALLLKSGSPTARARTRVEPIPMQVTTLASIRFCRRCRVDLQTDGFVKDVLAQVCR